MENVDHNESKVKKVLYNEVSLAIAIVSMVSGIIFWVTNPSILLSQRVSTLESDVMHNSKTYQSEENYQSETLDEIKARLKTIEERQILMVEALARVEAKVR